MVSDTALQIIFYSICDFLRRRNRQEVIVIKAVTVTRDQLGETCSICLEQYRNDEKVVNLKCSHLFHKTCFQKWVMNSVYCPLCRQICNQ